MKQTNVKWTKGEWEILKEMAKYFEVTPRQFIKDSVQRRVFPYKVERAFEDSNSRLDSEPLVSVHKRKSWRRRLLKI